MLSLGFIFSRNKHAECRNGAGLLVSAIRDPGAGVTALSESTHHRLWNQPSPSVVPAANGTQVAWRWPSSSRESQEAYLEKPPVKQLLEQPCAPEEMLVEVRVHHAGVNYVGGDVAALRRQQVLQPVGEQDKGQLALGVGAVRRVRGAVGLERHAC